MQKKKMRNVQLLALLWVLIASAALVAATYAWFTFSPATNVEPMSSTVSDGTINLLIANNPNDTFDVSCALQPQSNPSTLQPVSTADLSRFYQATAQNASGLAVLYQEVTDQLSDYMIHGTVYLQSVHGSCDVYLYRSGLNFGTDTQALAALRLGLKITAQSGTQTYLFRLDDMGSTASAASTRTVPTAGTVVSALSGSQTASYTEDPSERMSSYFAQEGDGDNARPAAGEKVLTTLAEDETASVEYWLYLEGCDENCINAVQERDFALQLAFAGVPATQEGGGA